jgi:hypothetical protein
MVHRCVIKSVVMWLLLFYARLFCAFFYAAFQFTHTIFILTPSSWLHSITLNHYF